MTLIVATAQGDTPDELYEAARVAARHADWVEVRLDGPSGLPWDLRPWFALDKPALATVRAREDGGRSSADDETRAAMLRRALLAGAHAIDVEFASDQAKSLIDEAHARGARVVVSLHDLEATPDDLIGTLRKMRVMGADIAKLATMVRGPDDARRLVEAAFAARDEGIPAAIMAVNDSVLRLLAPALGLALVYASVPGRPIAAPGQVDADAIRDAHAKIQPPISGRTRIAYLLGSPIAHSKSPAMQTAAFRAAGIDAVLLALDVDVPKDEFYEAVVGLRFSLGANVTTPLKQRIMPLMDGLAVSAQEAEAVNVVQVVNGKLIGHNTDGVGAVEALREARVKLDGARALVLGAGGAARAVVVALRRAGALVRVANRTLDAARALDPEPIPWEDAPTMLQRTDVLVNCTTVGMRDDKTPIPPTFLPAKGLAVLDAIYKPGGSTLLRDARARGLVAISGEAMLLHQGAAAFTLWTGRPAPLDAMRRALE